MWPLRLPKCLVPVQHQSGLKLATWASTSMVNCAKSSLLMGDRSYPWSDQGSLPLGKTRTIRVGPMDTSQRLHRRARCQAHETLNVDGVRVDIIWEGRLAPTLPLPWVPLDTSPGLQATGTRFLRICMPFVLFSVVHLVCCA